MQPSIWTLTLILFVCLFPSNVEGAENVDSARLRILDLTGLETAREDLYRGFHVVEDLGDVLLAFCTEEDPAALAKYGIPSRVIPLPAADKLLHLVSLKGIEVGSLVDRAQVLFTAGDIAIVAVPPAGRAALERPVPHQGLKRGIRPLTLQRIDPTRPFIAPAGWQAGTRAADPFIQSLVDQVDATNLLNITQDLQDMGNRKPTLGGHVAEAYLEAKFNTMDTLDVSLQHIELDNVCKNVIAELPGQVDPSVIYLVGSHYDSTNFNSLYNAPGADDNASGTAGVHEIARILSPYAFKYTLRFVNFTAEEWGLLGSNYYCDKLVEGNETVAAMINLDMTAYLHPGDAFDVDFITNYSSQSLINYVGDMYETYVPSLGVTQGSLSGGTSDHQEFTEHGFPACFPFEDVDHYSHYIHSGNDIIGLSANNFDLARAITQGALAALATLAEPVDLSISHGVLTDTADMGGPYTVGAIITPILGSAITRATLFYDLGSGYQSREMVVTGTAGGYLSSIPGLAGSGMVNYYIEAEDDIGTMVRLPETPTMDHFSFYVGTKEEAFVDSFEVSDNGWTHGGTGQDDWMRNVCTGNGGFDPGGAYDGARVWGNDLGVSGYNGNYSGNVNNWLESPSIDCTGLNGVLLRYYRWLTVERGSNDQSRILVNGNEVFANPIGSDLLDNSWVLHEIDISAYADNNSDVRIRFTLTTNGSVHYGGWNIDALQLVTLADGEIPPLFRSEVYLHTGTGGLIDFALDAGVANGGRTYLILGSLSGSSPGTSLPGGLTTLPINWDTFTGFGLDNLNSALFVNFLSVLDGQGQATAQLSTGPVSSLKVGKTMVYAYCLEGLPDWDFVSNPVEITFVP